MRPDRTALLIIDMQNDFCDPKGSLFVEEAPRTIPRIAALLERARKSSMPVFYTQDWHGKDDPEFAIWGEHARAGTWGAEIVSALAPAPGERVIQKARYDGFYGTSLDHELRVLGAESLIICGTVANICVHYTAASAALRWYEVIIPTDGISALSSFEKEATLHQVAGLFRGVITHAEGIEIVR